MPPLLKERFELILTIILLAIAGSVKLLLGEDVFGITITAITVVIVIIFYDVAKIFIYNKIVNPELFWLYHTGSKKFPFRSLQSEERSVKETTTIFIITPNLTLDTENKETIQTVSLNINRGVRYVFITSNDDKMTFTLDKLFLMHGNIKNISAYIVMKEIIDMNTSDNIMIFLTPGSLMRGFIQIPEGSGKFWAEMSEIATENYYKNMRGMLHDALDTRSSLMKGTHVTSRHVHGPSVTM